VIDPMLSNTPRILLPDYQYGNMHFERSIAMDTAQAEGLYRRDLFYWVNYATTLRSTATQIGIMQTRIRGGVIPKGMRKTSQTNQTLPIVDADS
jgi:hypothetical protein